MSHDELARLRSVLNSLDMRISGEQFRILHKKQRLFNLQTELARLGGPMGAMLGTVGSVFMGRKAAREEADRVSRIFREIQYLQEEIKREEDEIQRLLNERRMVEQRIDMLVRQRAGIGRIPTGGGGMIMTPFGLLTPQELDERIAMLRQAMLQAQMRGDILTAERLADAIRNLEKLRRRPGVV